MEPSTGSRSLPVESHLAECGECRELAGDAAAAVSFMERAAVVEAPPELVTRILFEITVGPSNAAVKPSWVRRIFGKWLEPVLQPKFAMGDGDDGALVCHVGPLLGIEVRQLKPSDLDPVKVWTAAEDRVLRTWERTVKYYENLRVVFENPDAVEGMDRPGRFDSWVYRCQEAGGSQMSTDAKVVGYCRACGKPLDASTVRTAHGTIYCEEHLPMENAGPVIATATSIVGTAPVIGSAPEPLPGSARAVPPPLEASPYSAPYSARVPAQVAGHVSPGLAFLLGLIPGVGAIYNGQYAKGLVHVIIIGLIISIISNGAGAGLEPLLSLLLAGFWAYMAFEAYHTAVRRQQGLVVDEFSSLIPMRGSGSSRFPVAPVVLIALGVIFLLDNLDLLDLHRLPAILAGGADRVGGVPALRSHGARVGIAEGFLGRRAGRVAMTGNFMCAIRGPILMITLGVLLAMDQLGSLSFGRTWPVLLIVFGLFKLAERAGTKSAGPGI